MVSGKIKVVIVAGTRPNFIKIAPLIKELKRHALVEFVLINTGQHYDFEMAGIFFKDLQIKTPDYNLGIGSGSHAYQMGTMMIEIEKIIIKENPTAVIVVGDVNSTLAAALTAKKIGVSVVHIEAGLRSGDERMPEETNRILTDHISDVLFCTEPGAVKNLLREGISKKKIYYVGNIMIDTLLAHKSSFDGYGKKIMQNFQLKPKEYALLTLHRQENVDDPVIFKNILQAISEIQKEITIIWPIHPRAKKRIEEFGLDELVKKSNNIILVSPLGYFEMLGLTKYAKLVLTDSGGIQEETTVLKIPCLTLRRSTERPVTVSVGTNKIVGDDTQKIIKESKRVIKAKKTEGNIPKYWDGKTAGRIVKVLKQEYGKRI